VAEFRLSPAAQGDLDRIFDYTVQQWGLEQAVRYTLALENVWPHWPKRPPERRIAAISGLAIGAVP